MPLRNSKQRFGAAAQLLHWGMLLLFTGLYLSAWTMQELPKGDDKWLLYALHKSLGITALLLLLVRIGWRRFDPPPEPLLHTAYWQRRVANGTHLGLYVTMLLMPLSGYIMSTAHGYEVEWFGLFSLPELVAKNQPLAEQAKAMHSFMAWTLGILLGLHLAGVVWHQFIKRDDLMSRMLPRYRTSSGS